MLEGMTAQRWCVKSSIRLVNPEGTALHSAYDSVTGECYELNEVAFRIVELLACGRTVPEIVETVEAEFSADSSLSADVEVFLRDLSELGLIEMC